MKMCMAKTNRMCLSMSATEFHTYAVIAASSPTNTKVTISHPLAAENGTW